MFYKFGPIDAPESASESQFLQTQEESSAKESASEVLEPVLPQLGSWSMTSSDNRVTSTAKITRQPFGNNAVAIRWTFEQEEVTGEKPDGTNVITKKKTAATSIFSNVPGSLQPPSVEVGEMDPVTKTVSVTVTFNRKDAKNTPEKNEVSASITPNKHNAMLFKFDAINGKLTPPAPRSEARSHQRGAAGRSSVTSLLLAASLGIFTTAEQGIAQVAVPPLKNPPVPVEAQAQNPATVDAATIVRLLKDLNTNEVDATLATLNDIGKMVEKHGKNVAANYQLLFELESLLDVPNRSIRQKAVEILGIAGDTNTLARVFLLFLKENKDSISDADRKASVALLNACIKSIVRLGNLNDEQLFESLRKSLSSGRLDPGVNGRRDTQIGLLMWKLRNATSLPEVAANRQGLHHAPVVEPHFLKRLPSYLELSLSWWNVLNFVANERGPIAVRMVPQLKRALTYENPKAQEATAEALGELGTPALETIPALENAQREGVKAAGPALEKLRALQKENPPEKPDEKERSGIESRSKLRTDVGIADDWLRPVPHDNFQSATPISPPTGPATGFSNGLHHKSKFLAVQLT